MKIKHHKKQILILLFPLIFLVTGCSHDNVRQVFSNNIFNGSEQSIEFFVTPNLLGTMRQLGLNVNPGSTPPTIAGEYLASRLKLSASNISGDVSNSIFSDTYFTLKNQDRQNLTIDLSYITANGSEISRGNETYISGSGNRFTILGKMIVEEDTASADMIVIISGKLTAEGITDFQFALFMLENHGAVEFIENNHGRLFYDSDNIAEKQ
jgi:hypothetical protein